MFLAWLAVACVLQQYNNTQFFTHESRYIINLLFIALENVTVFYDIRCI